MDREQLKQVQDRLYDVIIVGGGPAGLSAAIYLGRARYRVLVLEKEKLGGQIVITDEVVNYPGVLKTDGEALTATMRRQAEQFGAEFLLSEVEAIDLAGEVKTVKTGRGDFYSFGLVLATGANPRRLGFTGEAEFQGRGVAYCATCDGEFFTGKEVLVIGGGFAAAEEAIFLTKYARKVTVLVRKGQFSCAQSVVDQVTAHEKIEVRYHHELLAVSGDGKIEEALLLNNETGEQSTYSLGGESFGVFVFAGYLPNTGLLQGKVELDEAGYVVTDRQQKTSVDGVYAAGDLCIKPLRQVVTAVSDGAIAGTELEKHVAVLQSKYQVVPKRPEPEKEVKSQAQTDTQPSSSASPSGMDAQIREQLTMLFSKLQRGLKLRVYKKAGKASSELEGMMTELASLSQKVQLTVFEASEALSERPLAERPLVEVRTDEDEPSGLAFHGVPGGHEFQAFVLGLYNVAGPGQSLDAKLLERIQRLEPMKFTILVSLSCTQCPDLVVAAQRVASLNPGITAEVYELGQFPEIKEERQIMSVPCLLVNDGERTLFGKKNIGQLLELIEKPLA